MNRTPAGLVVPSTVDLASVTSGDRRTLAGEIASRERSWDAWGLSTWLPNPDPILKGLGRDIEVYRDLRADGHIAGCIRRRKSVVLTLEHDLDRAGATARVHRAIEQMLADLEATTTPDAPGARPGLPALISEALDGALYGYQPLEVTWARVGALLVPSVVQGKPPEWFRFDAHNRLRFRSRQAGADGELVPDRKFLLARQEPSYANPYGLADLSLVFWPAAFRKGGAKFWTYWLEKYGGTFLVGKLPRSAKPEDYADLTERLAAMIQDAVAAIPDDGSVEPLESGDKAGSSDAHERYLRYWRSEITIALLGSNQSMETDSTRASAVAGLEVADDLRDGDARMVESAVNQLIRWTVDLNWPGVDAPVWSLREQQEIDEARPRRDKILAECGVRFSRDYWLRTYDLEEGDLEEDDLAATTPAVIGTMDGQPGPGEQLGGNLPPVQLATPNEPADYADQQTERLGMAAEPAIRGWLDGIRAELDSAITDGTDLAEFRERLVTLYPTLPDGQLSDILGEALAAATLAGMAEVADEDQGA